MGHRAVGTAMVPGAGERRPNVGHFMPGMPSESSILRCKSVSRAADCSVSSLVFSFDTVSKAPEAAGIGRGTHTPREGAQISRFVCFVHI